MTRDYFAELYVAGVLADAKTDANGAELIRPVQVKGKYPDEQKTDKQVYGYVGRLNQVHPEMVLAIPYFARTTVGPPEFVAFMPFSQIRPHARGFRCQPASFKSGQPSPRREFRRFIDRAGVDLMATSDWR